MQGILQNYWPRVNKNLLLMGILLLLVGFLWSVSLKAQTKTLAQADAINDLINRAKQLKLAQNPAWLNLLHYKSTLFGAHKSQVDDAAFFFADTGAVDAQAELEASLANFFIHKKSAHPRCLFPARFYWLDSQLNLSAHLPDIECAPFNAWKEQVQATQITLLFPSMKLDDPATMFGHTFIRFDRADKDLQSSYTLSYGASYGRSDHLLTYSWKGVTGGYPGKFYLRTYAEALQDYKDIAHRDIWAYTLNFNQQEIDQLIRHIWEIKDMHFDYFFFRENCSYQLNALLDVAQEEGRQVGIDRNFVNLTMDKHPLYAIPVDTVRDIERAGLISRRQYLPATVQDIDDIDLDEKSNLNPVPPERSHASARWNLSYGEREQQAFYQIGLRPSFHDLLDSPDGFIEGAAISILESQFRWYKQEAKLKFESLNLFSLQSLTPDSSHLTPKAKKISFKVKQRDINLNKRVTEFETQFSMGYSKKIKSALMYAMASTQLEYASQLKNNHGFYLGADIGALWSFDLPLVSGQTKIAYQLLQQISGEEGNIQKLNMGLQFNIADEHALRFEFERLDYELFNVNEGRFSYLRYF